jgi:hypothetical protein
MALVLDSAQTVTNISTNVCYLPERLCSDPLYNPPFLIGLNQIGSASLGNLTLSIQYTDADVTYAPEPQTWTLMLGGLAVLIGCVCRKELLAKSANST